MSSRNHSFLAAARLRLFSAGKAAVEAGRDTLKRVLLRLFLRRKTPWLALTYDNESHCDGAGAQLHRIYAIYALSRLCGVRYLHSPLTRISYQGLAALEKNAEEPGLADRYNKVFSIPSDPDLPAPVRTCTVQQMKWHTLWRLKAEADRSKTFTLARCLYPYPVQEIDPESYAYAAEVSPFRLPASRPAGAIRVALHVRRGDLLVLDSDRLLPNSYYIRVATKIAAELASLNLRYVIELYSEIATKPFQVTPQSPGIAERILDSVVMHPDMNQIEEFDQLPHLEKFINHDAVDTLERLGTADVLVISRSSFSFLAGMLNRRAVVFSPKFWHAAPRAWITTSPTGDFSASAFRRRFKAKMASAKSREEAAATAT
jgi:hypothetical protein